MPPGLHDLPEPADLYARLTTHRPLDWGNRIPTKQQIAAAYGTDATVQSLTLVARAAAVEPLITEDLVASVARDTSAYQLASRVKSPQSLARKIRRFAGTQFRQQPIEDVVRYTILAAEPDDLIPVAFDSCDKLRSRAWRMNAAIHSYADGSRYKGLHLFLETHGERVEVQIHSRESIDVKARTAPLYIVERDSDQPRAKRDEARHTAIALSDQLRHPAGIEQLTTLAGVPVSIRVYGRTGGQPSRRTQGSKAAQAQHTSPSQPMKSTTKNGMSK